MGGDARALVVFDDARARRWSPFAEARPVGELRFGASLLRERVEAVSGSRCVAHLAGTELAGWDEPGAPPAVTGDALADGGPRLFWLSRAVAETIPPLPADRRVTLRAGDEVVGWSLPAGSPSPSPDRLAHPALREGDEVVEVEADTLAWPWDLVSRAASRLALDIAGDGGSSPDPDALAGVHVIGPHPLHLGPDARVGPGVVLDLRAGPIRLDEGTTVEGPARLAGPIHLGPHCTVFGGSLARVAAGPHCKLRGEIADTVFLGFANKAHDGYLGHALVGRWVNLGAGTTNSDLKNSYGMVRVTLPAGRIDTGLLKVGVFLGDHVKTGIGTLLTTGGVVGVGSNVFGGTGVAPASLPPFSWVGPSGAEPVRFDRFLEIAGAAMARRDHHLTGGVEGVLRRVWARTHGA